MTPIINNTRHEPTPRRCLTCENCGRETSGVHGNCACTHCGFENVIRKLPADVARCNGRFGSDACALRHLCMRHLSPKHHLPSQVFMSPAAEQLPEGGCDEFLEVS